MNESESSTLQLTFRDDRRIDVEGSNEPIGTCVSGSINFGLVSSTINPLDDASENKPATQANIAPILCYLRVNS